ncbi:MAG: hypothetical protein JSU60_04905 [Nitrospirota bacterium]|nr:MAG: hypothetical protein JSU60_04905 [Nitrospirota bacterium]
MATQKDNIVSWIETWIDPKDARFYDVTDLGEQFKNDRVSYETLQCAIVQLTGYADRVFDCLPEESSQFQKLADLLSEIPAPRYKTSIEHYGGGSLVLIYAKELIDPILLGCDVFLSHYLSFQFNKVDFGSGYREKAIEFAQNFNL